VKVLFVGGTGLISTACVDLAAARGVDLWLLNRGRTRNVPVPAGVRQVQADAHDPVAIKAALGGERFDAVVQWIGFAPEQVASDIDTFADAGQYVFVSSASAYEKPPRHYLVSEATTPLVNPFWQYSRDKITCEELLLAAHAERGFPVTIVRPSFTYGVSQIPLAVNSWTHPYTVLDRMRRGGKIIVPGDGTSLWVLTHNSDFAKGLVGLLGNPAAVGEAVHITSDEVLTWNDIYAAVGAAAGVEPDLLHVPSAALVAADPEAEGGLWGDKSHSIVFDNAKIRLLVPDFVATVPFAEGIRESVAWFDADPTRCIVDATTAEHWDRVVTVYTEALARVAVP
jgi:nucleoside-diphosphate-sugar epimerase